MSNMTQAKIHSVGAYETNSIAVSPENLSKLLRPKQAALFLGVSRSTLNRLSAEDPDFPKKIVISARCVGWRLDSLQQYMKAREAA